MNSNRKAYALIGVSAALIALQGAAVFGVMRGAQTLLNSEPGKVAMRAATIVATSVAGTVARDPAPNAPQFAWTVPVPDAPMVFDLRGFDSATVQSDTGMECYIVGPKGEVRKLDATKLSEVLENEQCRKLLEKVIVDVEHQLTDKVSECKKIELTPMPTI